MPLIYPILKGNEWLGNYTIYYPNSKGYWVEQEVGPSGVNVYNQMTLFNEFFDNKTGKISYSKKHAIEQKIDEVFFHRPNKRTGRKWNNYNSTLKQALNDFTAKNSLGGVDITEQEIYMLYERCCPIKDY